MASKCRVVFRTVGVTVLPPMPLHDPKRPAEIRRKSLRIRRSHLSLVLCPSAGEVRTDDAVAGAAARHARDELDLTPNTSVDLKLVLGRGGLAWAGPRPSIAVWCGARGLAVGGGGGSAGDDNGCSGSAGRSFSPLSPVTSASFDLTLRGRPIPRCSCR